MSSGVEDFFERELESCSEHRRCGRDLQDMIAVWESWCSRLEGGELLERGFYFSIAIEGDRRG
jgi:hypothetical protein